MKRTLLICGRYPLPEDHGSPLRTMNFVRYFLSHGSVDIAYSQVSPDIRREDSLFSNEIFLKKRDFFRNYGNCPNYKDRMHRIMNLKKLPLPILEFCLDSERLLLSQVETNDYDYILSRYLYNTSILFKLPRKYKVRTIVDYDDVLSGSLYDAMVDSVIGLHKKLIVTLNRKFLVHYERKCLEFGASLFCSDKDRAEFVNNDRMSSTFVVPNIYANTSFEGCDFKDGFQNANVLLFVGSLGYGPNVRGLKWFIESTLPDFRKKYPDARLMVVGRYPSNDIKDLCESMDGIDLYSDVPDLKEYYRKCRAVIVPLLSGGGTRIKILEAALAGRPVLSTPVGADGLDFTDGVDLLLFRNAHELCSQYTKLFDKNIYNSMIDNANRIVLNNYSIKQFNAAMETVMDEIDQKKYRYTV
jgi:glycosyltransferase involved in cell wall biosynthesis